MREGQSPKTGTSDGVEEFSVCEMEDMMRVPSESSRTLGEVGF